MFAAAIFGRSLSAAILGRAGALNVSHNFLLCLKEQIFFGKVIMSGFPPFILIKRQKFYLTLILVAFAFPEIRSEILYRAEAIMTSVPIFTASLTYSSLARAPFAPAREAPLQ